jgi:hypothetical protein
MLMLLMLFVADVVFKHVGGAQLTCSVISDRADDADDCVCDAAAADQVLM